MRFSWAHATAGALTSAVIGGLVFPPVHVLGPDRGLRQPVQLPLPRPAIAIVAVPQPVARPHRAAVRVAPHNALASVVVPAARITPLPRPTPTPAPAVRARVVPTP